MIVQNNFEDVTEAKLFALHVIQDVLVDTFQSTSNIKYQGHLTYTIQELLQLCDVSTALVSSESMTPISAWVRNRQNRFPKHVLQTVTPLLGAKFKASHKELPHLPSPIYPHQKTYREWVQLWTAHLITKASGGMAQKIFGVFRSVVHNKDVGVAHHILLYFILNILASENNEDTSSIIQELTTVFKDQVASDSLSTPDKKLLSAQVPSNPVILLISLNICPRLFSHCWTISAHMCESNDRIYRRKLREEDHEEILNLRYVNSSLSRSIQYSLASTMNSWLKLRYSVELMLAHL
jgi:serine/threonine-protein kinase ATR